MLCAIAYHAGDVDQAERLARWLRDLGGLSGHRLLVARDKSTQARPFADVGFDSVTEIEITDDAWHGWPHSANNAFHHCHRQIEWTTREPFLWLEPDVVPMCPGWLATIEAEYQLALAQGKSFLNDFVSVHTAELNVPDHGSGIGVYPGVMTDHDPSGVICLAHDLAWDCSGAPVILPQMMTSKHISHAWKHAPFVDYEQVQREIFAFKPDCVLFHASKDGSLIEILRKQLLPVPVLAQTSRGDDKAGESTRLPVPEETSGNSPGGQNFSKGREEAKPTSAEPILPVAVETAPVHLSSGDFAGSNPAPCAINLPVSTPDEPPNPQGDGSERDKVETASAFRGGQFITDILIKSYPQDYPLLEYCLKSLEKFASGFRRVIVIYPEGEPPNFWTNGDPKYKGIEVRENGDGYLSQQVIKINAHEYTDARYILHADSDVFFTCPITPATFFRDGKPFWLITPYAKIDAPWQASTEKFLGEPVEYEAMRRMPMFVPRSIHVATAAFCLMKHGVTVKDYIMAQPAREFSEFNVMGALAYSRAREDFTWLDTHAE